LREDLALFAWNHFKPEMSEAAAYEPISLVAIAARVAAAGHRCLVTDLTTVDLNACGLTVVRALVTGTTALDANFNHPHHGGRLGRISISNELPHPFP
jgi:hypothetical protein